VDNPKDSIFEQNFQNALKKLQECQRERNLSSCYECEKVLECEIRDEYVRKTYERMNKGSGGGFEF